MRRRILLVSAALPYPPTWGSGMRTLQLARHLAIGNDLTLLCVASPEERGAVEALRALLPRVEVVERIATDVGRRRAQARSLLSPQPFLRTESCSAELQGALTALLASGGYDLVQVEGSQLSGLEVPDGTPLVIDEHNIEYEILRRMIRGEASVSRRVFSTAEYLKYRPFERRAWVRARGVAMPSERESLVVRKRTSAPVRTVPNAIDPSYFAPAGAPPEADSLVFTGLLSYRPNLDAARALVHDVLPQLRRRRPGISVTVVGDGHPTDLAALRGDGVEVTGRVEDLRPFVHRATLVVAPIRMGSGTRLKVLEALAMGKALVTTAVGCEGIDVDDGVHLVVADRDPVVFADAVLALLDDHDRRDRLGRAGRQLVVERYTWQRSGEALEALHDAVLSARAPARRLAPA